MRVAMFSRFPSDIDQPKGGVESATVGLARGLARRPGVECHIVTLEKQRENVAREEHEGIVVHRLPGNRLPMIVDVFGGPGRRRIDEHLTQIAPDVVHFQETYGFGGPHPGIPSVFTVHGFDSLNLVTERKYLWRIRAPLWRLAEKKGIRSHSHLVSIAPYVTEELKRYTTADITPITNAINEDFFAVPDQSVPGRVFFAGWISSRKNLLTALKSLPQLVDKGSDVSLHAAGAFVDEGYLAEVKSFIAGAGLESRVQLLGRIGQQELRKELAEACVLVLPSYQENAPMAIAEAMAAGVPVVTSNVCGMPYMVDEGKAGFLTDPEDVDAIEDRLGRLLGDDALRREMGAYARQTAERTYHPRAVVDATLALYERVIAASKAAQ